MRKYIFIISILVSTSTFAQESLGDLLSRFNQKTVPYMSVQELAMPKTQAIVLDAREVSEYKVSSIENAIFVGYSDFNVDSVLELIKDKNQNIVVYCSLGIRSEHIAEKLKNIGYINVYNLYGGIFEWKNNGFPVLDSDGNETENVHAYDDNWSKWLEKGIKVYD